MKFPLRLAITALVSAAAWMPSVRASADLASATLTLLPSTGDTLVDGLTPTTTVNLAGDVVTEFSTCSGELRKRIIGGGADAIVTTQSFDARGNLVAVRDATGAGVDYTYDALNRKIAETDAKIPGRVTTFEYDAANRLISKTDPVGVVTTFEYDARDRLVCERTPMSATETRVLRYDYDGRGHLTSFTDANGGVTRWEFDDAGRNIAKTYPNGDRRTMEYDAAGRLTKLIDENGDAITSTYNQLGQLVAKHYAKDGSTDTFTYDAASRLLSATKGRYGHTLRYTYDDAGRLATETHPDSTVTRFAYDLANRLANLSTAPADGAAPAYSVAYGFDGRGLLAAVTAGDYATRYEYRINGQLASTVSAKLSAPQADILRTDRSYDAGARLLEVANTAANGDQAGVVYTLGNDNQRLTATDETGARWTYSYDQLKQLTGARKTDTAAATIPPLDQSYGYDPMGNRRTYTEQGKAVAYTTNSANQYTAITESASQLSPVTSQLVHDHNGNLLSDGTRTYTWDADNQLSAVTPVNPAEGAKRVEFTYDWRGRRITKAVATYTDGTWQPTGGSEFKYHEWNLIAEKATTTESINAQPTAVTRAKYYVWGNDLSGNLHGAGGVGGLLSMAVSPASPPSTSNAQLAAHRYFYAFDGNGNVRALIKADATTPTASAAVERYAYDGLGCELPSPGPVGANPSQLSSVNSSINSFRFSTKQLDVETSMNYYGHRFYAAGIGRWVSRDVILEKGGLNLYVIAVNDAVNLCDIIGKQAYAPPARPMPLPRPAPAPQSWPQPNGGAAPRSPSLPQPPQWFPEPCATLGCAAAPKSAPPFLPLPKPRPKCPLLDPVGCKQLYDTYKDRPSCGECTDSMHDYELKAVIWCLADEIDARSKYVDARCDFVLSGSIKQGSENQEKQHQHYIGILERRLFDCKLLLDKAPFTPTIGPALNHPSN